MKGLTLILLLLAAGMSALQAQTYDVLHDFGPLFGPEPSNPIGHLTLGPDGNFYGVSVFGGDATNCPLGCGTVFRLDSSGDVTTIHEFVGGDLGEFPDRRPPAGKRRELLRGDSRGRRFRQLRRHLRSHIQDRHERGLRRPP